MRTLYLLLDLPVGASTEEIRLARKRLLGLLHPDKHQGLAHADVAFKALGGLADILLDPRRRELYDEFGDTGLEAGFNPAVAREANRIAAGNIDTNAIRRITLDARVAARGTFVEVDVQRRAACPACVGHGQSLQACALCAGAGRIGGHIDVVCDGCGGFGFVATPWNVLPCQRCRGTRVVRVPSVRPCDACTGGLVLVPCASCRGAGYGFRLVPVRVTVPPGTMHGTLLRLAGQLEAGPQDAANDLYLEVLVAG